MVDNIQTGREDTHEWALDTRASEDDRRLVTAILAGDEAAFADLLDRYERPLLRLALAHVSNRAVAEEVVQETWTGVIEGLSRFRGQSSLKNWIFRILVNQAKTHARREHRSLPFSSFDSTENADSAVDPAFFQQSGMWRGHWISSPGYWEDQTPERLLLSKQSRQCVQDAIDNLPPSQQQVMVLRDMEGLSAKEACLILDISEANQRVLLHRARAKVRSALARHPYGHDL